MMWFTIFVPDAAMLRHGIDEKDQYSFGGWIGGILTFLSRNSLV